jgi:hypothetical protein
MNLVKDSVYEELPDIESAFDLSNKEDRAFMAIADENVLNGIFRTMGKLEKFYSLRQFLLADPRFMQFVNVMTTGSLAMAIPAFKEEYEESKPIDLVGTLSYDFFTNKISEAPNSGVTLDKNGILKIGLNLGA